MSGDFLLSVNCISGRWLPDLFWLVNLLLLAFGYGHTAHQLIYLGLALLLLFIVIVIANKIVLFTLRLLFLAVWLDVQLVEVRIKINGILVLQLLG